LGPATGTASLHPTIEKTFLALDGAEVSWCLLRGEADLSPPTGDVDLLVDPDHMRRVRDLLPALGFAPIRSWGHGPHAFLVAYDPLDDRWIKLDVVAELAFGRDHGIRSRAARGCLSRRVHRGSLWALAPDDEFWALLLHCLLDKGEVPSAHGERLRTLAGDADVGGPLAALIAPLCPEGWSPRRIIEQAGLGDWDPLLKLARHLAAAGRRRQPLAGFRSLSNRALRRAGRLVPGRGVTVALVAPDGAGKSTVAALLRHSFYLPGRSLYMGLYPRNGGAPGRRRIPGIGLSRRLLGQWRRYLAARYHRARGRLVVFDRYSYDVALAPDGPASGGDRLRRWLLGHAFPHPDVVVVLDVPGEVLYARKREHSPVALERQRRQYLRLRDRLPRAVVVDAAPDEDRVRREVTAAVWSAYASRTGRRR
jgi:thymidylate kinase